MLQVMQQFGKGYKIYHKVRQSCYFCQEICVEVQIGKTFKIIISSSSFVCNYCNFGFCNKPIEGNPLKKPNDRKKSFQKNARYLIS